MRRIFGFAMGRRANGVDPAPPGPESMGMAPGTQIAYDPDLIPGFEEDHKHLVGLVQVMGKAASEGQYAVAENALKEFRAGLLEHLLVENTRLYTYLSHCLRFDRESSALMDEMRTEMGHISRQVLAFVKAYQETGIRSTNARAFIEQLDSVAKVLMERIEREEGFLYRMYQPPAHFSTAPDLDL